MFKKLPLFAAFLTVIFTQAVRVQAQCNCASQYTLTGGSVNLTITNGQTYCLVSGTLTGNLEVQAGGKICVSQGATLNAGMNNFAGTVENRGTFQPAWGLNFAGGSRVDNYGTFTNSSINFNGAATLNNGAGGTFSTSSSFNLPGGTTITNAGTFSCGGDLNFNGQVTFTNSTSGVLSLSGAFNLANNSSFTNNGRFFMNGSARDFNSSAGSTFTNGGEFRVYSGNVNLSCNLTNTGMVYCANDINVNAGGVVSNACRFVAVKGFINNASFTNSGLVWATANNTTARIMNNGGATFSNTATAQLRGYDFSNDGTVSGSGSYYFTNATKNQGTVSGSSANPIQFYDASQTGGQIFDIQTGAMSNIQRPASMTPGDTATWGTCSEYNYQSVYNTHTSLAMTAQPLPVQLTGFTGNTDQRGDVWLNWNTAGEHKLSRFEVERSGNGKDFSRIATVQAKGGTAGGRYNLLDEERSSSATRYYRLKMVDDDGTFAYSSVLQFRTEGAAAMLSMLPNPVRSAATLSLSGAAAGTATVSVYDATGRMVIRTEALLGEGANSLPLAGAENLAPGTYLIRVSQNGQALGEAVRMQKL